MKRLILSVAALVVLCFGTVSAQTTEFTYQGSLKDGANAANGNYDFEFALFDAGGVQLGATLPRDAVAVANGIFSVSLDFGNQFPGTGRFLEIRVRPSGGAAFTPLTPRQPVRSAPYSVKSLSAENALSLGGVPANQYATDPAGSAGFIKNSTSQQTASNFNISGNGTAGGTLSSGVVNTATRYDIGGIRVLSNAGSNNIFAGAGAGTANTTGGSNAFFGANAGPASTGNNSFSNSFFGANAGLSMVDGQSNSYFGQSAGRNGTSSVNNSFFGREAGRDSTSTGGNSFFGTLAGSQNTSGSNNTLIGFLSAANPGDLDYATAIGANSLVSASNTIALGRANGSDTVRVYGRLRINTLGAASATNLCINTNIFFGGDTVSECSSSIRYKNNVLPFKAGLDTVGRLRPVSFDWKESNQPDLGLIAEEVEAIDPLLVTYDKDGQIQGVKYDQLSVVLINAVKEQQAQLDEQKKTINELRQIVCGIRPKANGCLPK